MGNETCRYCGLNIAYKQLPGWPSSRRSADLGDDYCWGIGNLTLKHDPGIFNPQPWDGMPLTGEQQVKIDKNGFYYIDPTPPQPNPWPYYPMPDIKDFKWEWPSPTPTPPKDEPKMPMPSPFPNPSPEPGPLYEVWLGDYENNSKLTLIKEVRLANPNLGLRDAKLLVDNAKANWRVLILGEATYDKACELSDRLGSLGVHGKWYVIPAKRPVKCRYCTRLIDWNRAGDEQVGLWYRANPSKSDPNRPNEKCIKSPSRKHYPPVTSPIPPKPQPKPDPRPRYPYNTNPSPDDCPDCVADGRPINLDTFNQHCLECPCCRYCPCGCYRKIGEVFVEVNREVNGN